MSKFGDLYKAKKKEYGEKSSGANEQSVSQFGDLYRAAKEDPAAASEYYRYISQPEAPASPDPLVQAARDMAQQTAADGAERSRYDDTMDRFRNLEWLIPGKYRRTMDLAERAGTILGGGEDPGPARSSANPFSREALAADKAAFEENAARVAADYAGKTPADIIGENQANAWWTKPDTREDGLERAGATAYGAAANAFSQFGGFVPNMLFRLAEVPNDLTYFITGDERYNLDNPHTHPGGRDSAAFKQSDPFREEAERMKDITGGVGDMVIDTAGAAGNMLAAHLVFSDAFNALGGSEAAANLAATANAAPTLNETATLAARVATAATNMGARMGAELLANPGNFGVSASSALNSYDEALSNGASFDQAFVNGLAHGLTEYYSNKLFSGTPFEDTGDEKGYIMRLTEYVSKKIGASDALKAFNESTGGKAFLWFFDKAGEGFEEVVTGVLDPLIDRLTYDPEADFATADELISEFLGGVLLSGMMTGGEAIIDNVGQAARDRAVGREIMDKMAQPAVIAEGQTYAPGTFARSYADELARKTTGEGAKPATAREIGQLYRYNEDARNESIQSIIDALKEAAERSAESEGEAGAGAAQGAESAVKEGTDTAPTESAAEALKTASAEVGVNTEESAAKAAPERVKPSAEVLKLLTKRGEIAEIAKADGMGARAVESITANYDGSVDSAEYYKAYAAFYNAGTQSAATAEIEKQYSGVISPAVMAAAYETGNYERMNATSEERAKQPFKRAGLDDADYKYAVTTYGEKAAKKIDTYAKLFGTEVRFVDLVDGGIANASIGTEGDAARIVLMEKGNKNPLLKILGHEWTHRMQGLSKDAYGEFRDAVKDRVQEDVDRIVKNYAKKGKTITPEAALDEAVADYAGAMLLDGKILDEFIEANRTNKTFLEKFRDWWRKIWARLTGAERRLADDAEKKLTAAIKAAAAAAKAEDTFIETPYSGGEETVAVDENGDRLSLKSTKQDFNDFEWDAFRNGRIYKDLRTIDLSDEDIKALFDGIADLVEYMQPNRGILDMNEETEKGDRKYKPFKPNSDPLYKISLDFSTLCRKRLMTQFVIEQLQLREDRPMSAEEQLAIRDMLKEYRETDKALQVACAMCYVEAARLKSPQFIEEYLADPGAVVLNYLAKKSKSFSAEIKRRQGDYKVAHGYTRDATKKEMKSADVNEMNRLSVEWRKEYKPTAAEQAIIDKANGLPRSTYLTADNLAALAAGDDADAVIYDAYVSNLREKTHSKGLETGVAYYYGDSAKVSKSRLEGFNRENGLRFDSWSDFQFEHMLDMMTAIIELSTRKVGPKGHETRGVKMHGYTKFPEMVRIFGNTGMMFNLSGVSEGDTGIREEYAYLLDENRELTEDESRKLLIFSANESIDFEEAVKLREEFPETAGLQCIGISDAHIRALLRSSIIDYIIPYHTSGMNATLRRMANIYDWQDYQGQQEATAINPDEKWDASKRCRKEDWHKEPVFSEFFDSSWYSDPDMDGLQAMRKAAENYIQLCKDRGMKPKFQKFTDEANYWKLLIDRKMIDQRTGRLLEQKPVRPVFKFDAIKKEVDKYVENYDPDRQQRALDYVVSRWSELPERIETLKQTGAVKENIRKSMEIEKNKRALERQASVLGNEMIAAQQRSAVTETGEATSGLDRQLSIKDMTPEGLRAMDEEYLAAVKRGDMNTAARMVKEYAAARGYTEHGYHGTVTAGFTVIDPTKGKDEISFFVTSSELMAQSYSGLFGVRRVSNAARTGKQKIADAKPKIDALIDHVASVLYYINAVHSEFMADDYSYDEASDRAVELCGQIQTAEDADDSILHRFSELHMVMENLADMAEEDLDHIGDSETEARRSALKMSIDTEMDGFYSAYNAVEMSISNFGGSSGNYELYYDPSGLLEVDGNHSSWRNIRSPKLPDTGGHEHLRLDGTTERVWKTREIARYAYDEGYAGVRIRDIYDNGGLGMVDPGAADVTILFFPSVQAKSADPVTYDDKGEVIPLSKRFDWANDDLRWSMKEQGEEDDIATLISQNRSLQEAVEYWRGETKRSGAFPRAEMRDVKAVAKSLIADYQSSTSAASIEGGIRDLAEALSSPDYTVEAARAIATDVIRKVLKSSSELSEGPSVEMWAAIRSVLTSPMRISQGASSTLAADGTWREWRTAHSKSVNVSINGKTMRTVSDAYSELSQTYPDLFPSDITDEAEQVLKMLDVADTLTPIIEDNYSTDLAYAIEYGANDLIQSVLESVGYHETYADKAAARVQEARETERERGRERLAEQKAADRERLERRVQAEREHTKERVAAVRAQKNARIAEIQRRNVAHTQALLQKVRAQRDARIADIMQHNREMRELQRERRELRADQERLLKVARRLERMRSIPEHMDWIKFALGDLDTAAINITGKTILKLTEKKERVLSLTDIMSPDYDADYILTEATKKELARLDKTPIASLTHDEVLFLTRTLQFVEARIALYKKAVKSQLTMAFHEAGVVTVQDVDNTIRGKLDEKLSPTRAADRIVGYRDGSPLSVLMRETVKGEGRADMYKREALRHGDFARLLTDKQFLKDSFGKDAKPITIYGTDVRTGKPVALRITQMMRVALYLHSLNDDNFRHIRDGGILIPDFDQYVKGKTKEAYNEGVIIKMSRPKLAEISHKMTAKERQFAEALQWYYNTYAPKYLNEASIDLDGWAKFTTKDYYPIRVDADFLSQDVEAMLQAGDPSLARPGWGEERKQSAMSIVLYDASSEFNRMLQQNAAYAFQAIPLHNLNRLLNVNVSDGESVKKAIGRAFSDGSAMNYLKQYMADYAGRGKQADPKLQKIMSNYAGAVLVMSAGTAFKQFSSYPAAANILRADSMLRAFNAKARPDLSFIDEMTAVFTKRKDGFTNMERAGLDGDSGTIPKALNWIQGVDVFTTWLLKRATYFDVIATNPELQIGSREFKEEVVDRYERVIRETQPNYSTALRPGLLRSQSDLKRALAMFATQPLQYYNILYDSINRYQAKAKQALNTDPDTDEGKAARAEKDAAKRQLAKSVGSVVASTLLFAVLGYAFKHISGKDKRYKDKDGNPDLLSWLKGISLDVAMSLAGMWPILGKTLVEIIEYTTDQILKKHGKDAFFEQSFYGMDVASVSAIADTLKDVGNAVASLTNVKDEPETAVRQSVKAAEDVAMLFGIPLKNVENDLMIIARPVMYATFGKPIGQYYMMRLQSNPSSGKNEYYDYLYNLKKTDYKAYNELYRIMCEDDAYASASKTSKENIDAAIKKREKAG